MNAIVRLRDKEIVVEANGKLLGSHPHINPRELWEVISRLRRMYGVREFTVVDERT